MQTLSGESLALIGCGSIGLSFAALYLQHTDLTLHLYDPRNDLRQHLESALPVHLNFQKSGLELSKLYGRGKIKICSSLKEACETAHIVQEQCPENIDVKRKIWLEISAVVGPEAHLWTSTSGITASQLVAVLDDKSRLLVVHPFNPPHVMPLIEIVPCAQTADTETQFAMKFFQDLGSHHQPVLIRKEVPGFVGNRLAFVLFREALSLVKEGVVTVEDLDRIVEDGIGLRWAASGPFKTYNFGGGTRGLEAFMYNLSHSIQNVWDSPQDLSLRHTCFWPAQSAQSTNETWGEEIVQQVNKVYGFPTLDEFSERDERLLRILRARQN